MKYAFIVAGGIFALVLAIMLVCFFKIFYSRRKKETEEFTIPAGEIYEAHRPQMVQWIKDMRAMAHRECFITSEDGLRLYGRYYEYKKGAPMEILFHGYRGTSERDLCGGVHRCFALGRNALIVDHRAAGKSEGRVITFGAKESRDALLWVDYAVREIDPGAKIILTGISMGAATVMMAASKPLPKNVVGILADCGYTSTREIIKKVIRDMHLPANFLYPFARLSAIVFGGFDPDSDSPRESMKKTALPVIFFHGDEDSFVPATMSEENYAACASEKKLLVLTPGAGHGLCFPTDQGEYLKALEAFFAPILEEKTAASAPDAEIDEKKENTRE